MAKLKAELDELGEFGFELDELSESGCKLDELD